MPKQKTKRADETDAEVGRRVRARRLELSLSQSELAAQLGVTFQQVQKYEKGVNRIGASRLQAIAQTLKIPMNFFFSNEKDGAASESVFKLLQSSGSVRILTAFQKITSKRARQVAVEMLEELARTQRV